MINGRALLATTLLPLSMTLHAQDVVLDAGPGTIPVDVEMSLDIPFFGPDTSSASTTAEIAGSQFLIEREGDSITFKDHLIVAQNAQFSLQFFCGIFGCIETIDITISNLVIRIESPTTTQLQGDQWTINGALYNLDITYEYQGGFVGSGSSQTLASDNADLSGTFTEGESSLSISNLDLSEVLVAVLPESLPGGVNSIDIRVDADLSGLVHEGALPFLPEDLDQDGKVCGSDLTLLLSLWGQPGPADFDLSGVIDGADLARLLNSWNC